MNPFDGPPEDRPLAESRRGYYLAVLGGVLGAPLGLILSPVVLFLLTRVMHGDEEDVVPNRFAVWALIGVVAAPLSLVASNPEILGFYRRTLMPASAVGAVARAPFPLSPKVEVGGMGAPLADGAPGLPHQAAASVVEAAGLMLSNVSITPYDGDAGGIDYSGGLWIVTADVVNNSKEVKTPSRLLSVELVDAEGRSFGSVDYSITSNSVLYGLNENSGVLHGLSDSMLPGSVRKNVQIGIFDVTKGVDNLRLCVGELLYPGKKCLRGGATWGADSARVGD